MARQYKLDLYQSHIARSHTETFVVEAGSQEEAENQANKIAKDKGLKKDFDFEVSLIPLSDPEDRTEEEKAADEAAVEEK